MKILFLCFSTLVFDVRTPYEKPLGGTESALCYLSTELAKRGHNVFLMRNSEIDDTGTVIGGVTHLRISEDIASLDPDVVIVASAPMAAPAIKKIVPRAKIVLWNHMQPDQPAMATLFQADFRSAIDKIVYVSESQKKKFTGLSKEIEGDVITNAIAPAFENLFKGPSEIFSAKKCLGAYTSTPYRGLSILASIQELPIDIFSSMAVYQGDDSEYEKMYTELKKKNDCLMFHGSVAQGELARYLRPAAFLVYPSIFTECHSIAIIEAMAAGLKVVTTDVAHEQTEFVDSLPSQGATVEEYTKLLRKNINRFRAYPEEWAENIWKQVQYINQNFTWALRAHQWEAYLKNLITIPT
jgi:glycosyltransferase involved in cell wall biosynthesis